MKKKLNRKDYMFDGRKDEILIKLPGQINGLDFVIMNCENCEIYICDHTAQVFVDDSVNCKIFFGPCEGSLFIRECSNIEISSASSQFRCSNSKDIKAYIYTSSDPALEKVTNILFAPYNFSYPHIDEHFINAKLNLNNDKWSEVFDFTPNLEKRNWNIMPPQEYPGQVIKNLEDFPLPPANPVPIPIAFGGQSTKPIIVGSSDAQSKEKGGDIVDFSQLMSKQNVQNIMNQENVDNDFWYQGVPNQIPVDTNLIQLNQTSIQPKDFKLDELTRRQREVNIYQRITYKQSEEQEQKLQIQQKAKLYLENFRKEYQNQINARKRQNLENEQVLKEITKNNEDKSKTYDFISKNIGQKPGEYKGEKNVQRMWEAIFNKKNQL